MTHYNKKSYTFSYATMQTKEDQLQKVDPKVWGHEEWIINDNRYCGKKLVLKAGFETSLHFHKIKDETFYLLFGIVAVHIGNTIRILKPGDSQRIMPLEHHKLVALTNAEVIEFSTFHQEEDSYRITHSGPADISVYKKIDY